MMLVFPASAQSNSDYWIQSTGSAGVLDQSELNRPLTSPDPATPKAGFNIVLPTAKTKATASIVESKAADPQPESKLGIKKAGSAILINIDKANQKMMVFLDGVEKYNWPVSTGKAGYSTPSGTYTATSMNEIWYSKQWDNAPMPHSIFFMKDGHAIHGSYEVKNLGSPASHGCVRISPENAAKLYALVAKNGLQNTQVVLTGSTPGGEFKVASPAGAARYSQADVGGYHVDNYYTQPQTRPGFFERLFGGPYYNSQGNYGQSRAFYQQFDDRSGALAGVGGMKLPYPYSPGLACCLSSMCKSGDSFPLIPNPPPGGV
jgi:lipoprotein-anchoring transpeptidase ErfK/SrfK